MTCLLVFLLSKTAVDWTSLYLDAKAAGENKDFTSYTCSNLDLMPLFDVSTSYVYLIFEIFLIWILHTLDFLLTRWLRGRYWKVFE